MFINNSSLNTPLLPINALRHVGIQNTFEMTQSELGDTYKTL